MGCGSACSDNFVLVFCLRGTKTFFSLSRGKILQCSPYQMTRQKSSSISAIREMDGSTAKLSASTILKFPKTMLSFLAMHLAQRPKVREPPWRCFPLSYLLSRKLVAWKYGPLRFHKVPTCSRQIQTFIFIKLTHH